MEFAQRLALLLEEKGVSRGKLARSAGVHTSTVTNWINGKKPTIDNLVSVAEFFGVPISYLTDDTNISENILEQKEKPTLQTEGELSPSKQKAWEFIQKMDDETLDRFIAAAKAFIE